MRIRHLATALCVAALVGSCSLLPSAGVPLQFENGTTLDIVLRANGAQLDPAPPGASGERVLTGPFPIRVEAVTPGGRFLGSMVLDAAPTCSALADGRRDCTGGVVLVDLVCGRFAMWASDRVPSFPAPIPGQGEPCGP